ncbi:MAG: hypothetical protein PHF63_00460 [Herbinix sp.]|nr:hypothetical protein [Herbinix sp.]
MAKKINAFIVMESMGEVEKPSNIQVVKENNLSYIRFKSTLQDLEVRNRNGRKYMRSSIVPGLQAQHIQELMAKKSWCGEAGHPLTNDKARILTIDPKAISHRICSTEVIGNTVKGVIETLDNGSFGNEMTKLVLQGVEAAFSLRALAKLEVDRDGSQVAIKPAHIVTYDWVFLPSHKTAYLDDIREVQLISKDINSANVVKEGYMEAVTESSLIDYIVSESKNIQIISDIMECSVNSFKLSKDLKSVVMESSMGKIEAPIEEKIERDISRYMSKIF